MRNHLYIYVLLMIIPISVYGDYWTQKADFGGANRADATGFSILNKGYIGTGYTTGYASDWWEFDQSSNTWVQKAAVPNGGYVETVSFSIGTKGYLLTYPGGQDFWRFDPTANTWTQMAAFPGPVRQAAVSFVISGKGYVTTGSSNLGSSLDDLWEYNPLTNGWLQKASLPSNAGRHYATGFAVGNKGYVCTGINNSFLTTNDLWEYNALTDAWIQRANFPGAPRQEASGFAIGSKGYVGMGSGGGIYYHDFYMYDPGTDTWTAKADFLGGPREEATQFSMGNFGYVGTGYDGLQPGVCRKDFWEYHPEDSLTSVSEAQLATLDVNVWPNPLVTSAVVKFDNSVHSNVSLVIYDMQGRKIVEDHSIESPYSLQRGTMKNGQYILELIADNKTVATKKILVASSR